MMGLQLGLKMSKKKIDSVVDISLVTPDLVLLIKWRVTENPQGSDNSH